MLNSGVNVWRFASGLAAYYGGVGFVLRYCIISSLSHFGFGGFVKLKTHITMT